MKCLSTPVLENLETLDNSEFYLADVMVSAAVIVTVGFIYVTVMVCYFVV